MSLSLWDFSLPILLRTQLCCLSGGTQLFSQKKMCKKLYNSFITVPLIMAHCLKWQTYGLHACLFVYACFCLALILQFHFGIRCSFACSECLFADLLPSDLQACILLEGVLNG